MIILVGVVWIIILALLSATLYRAGFTSAALFLAPRTSTTGDVDPLPRFAVLIPAHDEELLIAEVIRSIRAADYDQARIEIHVIADNCSDGTADRVRSLGERVHERTDPSNPGKGQALEWMLSVLDWGRCDAVAFFDADNLVDRRFFRMMSRELGSGHDCLQGYYDIANPGESVVTRLLAVTYVMKNLLFNAGKSRLGLSVSLMGTGMVFQSRVLRETGWRAMSVGEDLEQSFNLLEAGHRIKFVPEARTRAQEVTTLDQGYTQRQRWASGRRALHGRARAAIRHGLRHGSLMWVDAGIELLMPSYSKLLTWTVVMAVPAVLVRAHDARPLAVLAFVAAYQVVEVGIALWIMRATPQFLVSLAFAPVFLAWKTGIDLLAIVGHRKNEWTRTARQPHVAPDHEAPSPEKTGAH